MRVRVLHGTRDRICVTDFLNVEYYKLFLSCAKNANIFFPLTILKNSDLFIFFRVFIVVEQSNKIVY